MTPIKIVSYLSFLNGRHDSSFVRDVVAGAATAVRQTDRQTDRVRERERVCVCEREREAGEYMSIIKKRRK